MAYSTRADLLTGDVQFGSTIDPDKYVGDAADEMNVRIGMVYELPLPALASHLQTLLVLINNRLASGRLIMAAATASQDRNLHAYGQSLVELAFADLSDILNGTIVLDGATRKVDESRNLGPSITNFDDVSSVDVMEAAMYPTPGTEWLTRPFWRPGS